MKTQRITTIPRLQLREPNARLTRDPKRAISPGNNNINKKPQLRDRKAQYLKQDKECENRCKSTRGMRKSMGDEIKKWLGPNKITNHGNDALKPNDDFRFLTNFYKFFVSKFCK